LGIDDHFSQFSILDYAGSDKLWAGVITHISSTLDEVFGKWSVKFFRAWHCKPDTDLKPFLEERLLSKHKTPWTLSVRAVVTTIVLICSVGLIILLWSLKGLSSYLPGDGEGNTATAITTMFAAVLGIKVATHIGDIFSMVRLLLLSAWYDY